MASRDELVTELRRLSGQPRFTFEKGLLITHDDNAEGFCTDLCNMEIQQGAAIKRAGTKCLNNPDELIDILAMHNDFVSGSELLFIVTTKLELFAISDAFPEKLMPVFKKGFCPVDNSKDFPDNFIVKFSRGSHFFFLSNDQKLRILNEHGDTLTINKRGYIQFFGVLNDYDSYSMIADIQAAREYDVTTVYLGIEVDWTTHRNPPKFYITKQEKSETIPVIGDVRVAYVNNEGIVGKLSEPTELSERTNILVSVADIIDLKASYKALELVYEVSDTARCYGRRSGSFAASTPTAAEKDIAYTLTSYLPEIESGYSVIDVEVPILITRSDSDFISGFMWFDYGLSTTTTDYPNDIPNYFMYMSGVKLLGSGATPTIPASGEMPDSLLDGLAPYPIFKFPAAFYIQTYKPSSSLATLYAGTLTNMTEKSAAERFTGNVYKINFFNSGARHHELSELNTLIFDNNIDVLFNSIDPLSGIAGVKKAIGRATIRMLKNSAGKYKWCEHAVAYTAKIPNQGEPIFALTNKGYDCWDVKITDFSSGLFGIPLGTITIDRDTLQLTFSSTYDVISADYADFYRKYFLEGGRIAIWNNDKIIAVSQMKYCDSTLESTYVG